MEELKTKYKHIEFLEAEKKPKTSVYLVKNHQTGDRLGVVFWHSPWRQYVLRPFLETLWSRSCLDDVSDFINQLMEARKKKKE